MIRRLLLLVTLSVALSGCFMGPMALIGPASKGFSTASIVESAFTTSGNYVIKKITGKTVSEHAYSAAMDAYVKRIEEIGENILVQSYFPEKNNSLLNKK